MTAMSTTEALVGVIIIIGFLAALAGFVVFFALAIADLTERYRSHHFPPAAGRSESPPSEGSPAPIFPLEMQRRRRRNRSAV